MDRSANIFPAELPEGFEYLNSEPEFVPSVHLQLDPPDRVWRLRDFGYAEDAVARFASQIAATSPTRVLSKEGVAALREVVEMLEPFIHRSADTQVPAILCYTVFRSRFIRDLSLCQELTDFLSGLFEIRLTPHSMPHLLSQMNFAPEEINDAVHGWHYDLTAFTSVLMLHDPQSTEGGEFEYFMGTRQEGARLIDQGKALPRDKLVAPPFPSPGYACFMQGAAIMHHARPLKRPGYRASLVTAYCSRNFDVPDPNRVLFHEFAEHPEYDRWKWFEWARHKAWISREKLDLLLKRFPYTEDRQAIAQALREAVADATTAAEVIEASDMSLEQSLSWRARADEEMMLGDPEG